ncbi:retrovirus-related pol polyprotein from transposon TNT 1-94 [Tanacetum coccineum]
MMANISEDIQCARSDTHPLMLDKTDFESWQQRIRLYCLGKDNGVNILKSIDKGPFKMGKFIEILAEGTKGALHLGPERDRVFADLTPEEKERFKADIHATHILLQGLPKDIYILINHYTNAKDIWDDVKTLLEVQKGRVVVQNVQGRQNRGQGNYAKGVVAAGNGGVQKRVGNANPGGQTNTFDDGVDEALVQDMALNEDNTMFMANLSSTDPIYDEVGPSYDLDILSKSKVVNASLTAELARYKEQVELYERRARFELNEREQKIDEQLSIIITDRNIKEESLKKELHSVKMQLYSTIGHNKSTREEVATLKKDFKQKENKYLEDFLDMKALKEKVEDKLFKQDQSLQTVHMLCKPKPFYDEKNKKCDEIERKNLLIANENSIADCLSNDVFYTATNSVLTVSRFSEMHNAYTVKQARCLELEAEISKLKHHIQKDDHSEMIKRFSNLEDAPEFDSIFKINKIKASLQGKDNTIRKLKVQISQLKDSEADRTLDFRALDFQITELTEKVIVLQEQNKLFRSENATIKQHYKELYDCIKITRAKTVENTTALLDENKNLKAQIIEKMKCVTMDSVKPKVLAPEEARVEKPLDSSLASACLYTKQSQELVEYVIDMCPKDFNKRDKKIATAPLTRKNQVTFKETSETSNDNTQKYVKPQKEKKTNVPMIPSTGLISSTEASGSKPRSNIKNNRILPTKSVNKKKVEDHNRNNKSNLKQTNRVDSSINYKRIVINSNSDSLCKTCNKCLISAKHDVCVAKYLNFANAPPNVKKVLSKVKQVWKATGKMFTNVGYQWKPTRKKFTLREQCPLTRLTKSKCDKAISTSIPTTAETQTIDASVKYTDVSANQQDPNRNWGSNIPNSPSSNFVKKFIGTVRFGNDHFGAIIGYGDYVIDLEVAFRKHSCYVRNEDCVDLLKGSRGSNLYTISVEDVMKSSPICLLSKASKNKSLLWHRWLNHLNFDTINDLARKDLVRGLPRLKFEKDHFCLACQLGKSKKYTHKPKSENTIMEVLHTLYMDLCLPMRVQSINKKKYILVINDVVKRRNRTLVEAARTMLIFSKAPMFLWAEAVATACYT